MKRLSVFVRLGFKHVYKLGIIPFLCLTLSFILFGFAAKDLSGISQEKNLPCTVIAYGADISQEQIATASEINGVLISTAVISLPAQLTVGDYTRELTVYAVDSQWISDISQGEAFPDASTMPYIVLTEKSLEGFEDKTGKTVFSDSVAWQDSDVSMNGFYGSICGLTTSDTASVGYISHSAAETMLLFNGEIPVYTQIWLKLENSGYEESVISALAATGLSAATQDNTKWQNWKTDTQNALILCLSATVMFLSAVAVIREKIKYDLLKSKSEYTFLRHTGAKKHDFTVFFFSMLVSTIFFALIASALIFLLLQNLK